VEHMEKTEQKPPEQALKFLRRQREEKCFAVINRGNLFWELKELTDAQKGQLKDWYLAWLDVTKTLVIPKQPDFI